MTSPGDNRCPICRTALWAPDAEVISSKECPRCGAELWVLVGSGSPAFYPRQPGQSKGFFLAALAGPLCGLSPEEIEQTLKGADNLDLVEFVFAACDSALSIVREAQDADGAWREIESAPQTICGNSFHRVFLGAGQYWEFPARLYSGPIKTKLRFRLDPGGGKPAVYSNEFDGQVTAAQFGGRG